MGRKLQRKISRTVFRRFVGKAVFSEEQFISFCKTVTLFEIDNPVDFLSQSWHESAGLKYVRENLNYSPANIMRVFGKYFTNLKMAIEYAYNSEKLSNYVYANRMGNGPPETGDGFRYRGITFFQITGKDNIFQLAQDLGILNKVKKDVEILLQPEWCWNAGGWYWVKKKLNKVNCLKRQTRIINGGFNGLKKRYDAKRRLVRIMHNLPIYGA